MSKQARGLGRGLDALIRNTTVEDTDANEKVNLLAISEIEANKFQPRKEFDDEALEELMQSIKQYGVLQPILVRRTLTGYELIAGERRLRASKRAGLKVIPAIVREYSDSEMTEIALIENLQREDLTAIEEATAYEKLLTIFGLTQEELAQKVGRSRSHIANFIRMLSLPKVIQDYVSRETISMGQAKPLITLDDENLQIEAAEYIIAEDLSARASEDLVKILTANPNYLHEKQQLIDEADENETILTPDVRELFVVEAEDRLKLMLGTQVKIKQGKKKSRIEIDFYSQDDLDRIIEALSEPISLKSNKNYEAFTV
ncbi:ParB/RepB/Spo0J family partition protein [Anaerosinus massiliensis]|uniref:ParB/RepB/Spo0J family partition protein n=1 Tax=Massilibacillus massiliensis TaxID=1806837 RepID=UPI000A9DFB3C|nr:ParB/RepB/Spo0J family partition protein [Massilibacillus massiliensis]